MLDSFSIQNLVKDEFKIIAIPHSSNDYSYTQHYESLIGNKCREWFSDHAYLCLPLTIGNQYGFVVKSTHTFDVTWNGGRDIDATTVNMGKDFIRSAPWVSIVPGIAIGLTVLGFNLVGDGLRDYFDPKMDITSKIKQKKSMLRK